MLKHLKNYYDFVTEGHRRKYDFDDVYNDVFRSMDIITSSLDEVPSFIEFKKRFEDHNSLDNDIEYDDIQEYMDMASKCYHSKFKSDECNELKIRLDDLFIKDLVDVLFSKKRFSECGEWVFENWFFEWLTGWISDGEFNENLNFYLEDVTERYLEYLNSDSDYD